MGSGPEYFRLGRRELFVGERARGVQLCEVLDLVGRVRRRGRILRLVLAVIGRRLVPGRRLVVVLLLLPGPRGLMVSNRRSAHRSDHQRPPPYTSPETHGKLLPVRLADLRLSGQCALIVVLDRGALTGESSCQLGCRLACLTYACRPAAIGYGPRIRWSAGRTSR